MQVLCRDDSRPSRSRCRILAVALFLITGMTALAKAKFEFNPFLTTGVPDIVSSKPNRQASRVLSASTNSHYGRGAIQSKETRTEIGPFIQIAAGEFLMGDQNGQDSEKPVHKVRISRVFEMGKYEVTQAQWQMLNGTNPSKFKGANHPVEQVSWNDVQAFIKLNSRNDGYVYRLPTEAEWEYACRAGTTGDYAGNLDEMAWYAFHPPG
jgi:formylglycine-generating enzyme required for sulfatase activity